jgi:hypothetical protein
MVSLAVGSSSFIDLVGEIELRAVANAEVEHDIARRSVILIKLLLAFLIISIFLIGFWLIEITPGVLYFISDHRINTHTSAIYTVNVVETHIAFVMIILEDYRSLRRIVTRVFISLNLKWRDHHREWELVAIQVGLHVSPDLESDDDCAGDRAPIA